MSRIQLKIMLSLALLIVGVVAVSGILAERGLTERTTSHQLRELEQQAKLVRELVAPYTIDEAHEAQLREIVSAGAEATSARITLIAADGTVVADSGLPESELRTLSNHADRPEVIEAIADGTGSSLRRSDTLKRPFLYVAVRVPAEAPFGGASAAYSVVRMSIRLDELDAAVAELRSELVAAGALGLLAALGLSYLLSRFSLRPIRELREVVADIAAGKFDRRLRWHSQDERREIAVSINQLARQMRDSLDYTIREKVQLEAVLSSMGEGVIVTDHEGKLLLVNPRAREMLSVWGEFEGRMVPEVIRSPDVDQVLQDVASGEGTVVREFEFQADVRRVILMHATRFSTDTPHSGTVAVFHDVSELRRVDAVRSDFIANASHELRTPLTSIQGFADTLRNSEIEPEQRAEYLDVIVRNAQRMSSLIDDLLTLSRIEGGTSTPDIGPVDPVRVVDLVIADFGPRFEEASIEVERHASRDLPMCLADQGALEQVVSNLLSNAARYSNPGSKIDVYVEARDDVIEIQVADTGIGIPEKDLERIFERFYRVDAARSRALGSTGLGLSIVKHLVRSMHGEIRVESEVDKGTRFSFTLPRA